MPEDPPTDPRPDAATGDDDPPPPDPRLPTPTDIPPVSAEELVDGALPEPGLEPERRYPSTIGGALYLLVLVVSGVALGVVVTGDWRLGVRILAGSLFFAALARLVLRPRDAGMLAVRAKSLDAGLMVLLGGLLLLLAGSIPDQPGF